MEYYRRVDRQLIRGCGSLHYRARYEISTDIRPRMKGAVMKRGTAANKGDERHGPSEEKPLDAMSGMRNLWRWTGLSSWMLLDFIKLGDQAGRNSTELTAVGPPSSLAARNPRHSPFLELAGWQPTPVAAGILECAAGRSIASRIEQEG